MNSVKATAVNARTRNAAAFAISASFPLRRSAPLEGGSCSAASKHASLSAAASPTHAKHASSFAASPDPAMRHGAAAANASSAAGFSAAG